MQDKEAERDSAEACDDMASVLAAAKSRVERARSFGSETTMAQRAKMLATTVQNSVLSLSRMVISIPGRMARFLALSSAERGKVYKGWWAYVKKEAYHYWVSFLVAPIPLLISSSRTVTACRHTDANEPW